MSTESTKSTPAGAKKSKNQPAKRKAGILQCPKPLKPIILFALIKLSGIGITEASGKLGGNVFSRTKGGTVIRNRVVPNNPQSIAQQAVRAIFGAISSAWRSLTEIERNAWNEVAQDYPYQNALGETKILSGKALFQKLNNNLLYAGEAILNSPLAPAGVNAPVTTDNFEIERAVGGATIATGTLDVTSSNISDATTIVVLEMTAPLSPGVKNANNRFVRVMQETMVMGGASFDFSTTYADLFGIPAEDAQVQARVFSVNPNTGEKSAYLKASVLVTQAV